MKIVGKDFWTTKFFPHDFFTVPWDRKNSTVKRDMPCLVHRSFFAARTFAKHRKVPNEIFQYCVTKTFRRKNVISSSLIHTKFLLPGNFWSTQEFPLKFFGNVRQNNLDGRTWCPLLSTKQFFTKKGLLKHRSVPSEIFCKMWDKETSTEKSDIPLSSKNFFKTWSFLNTWKVLQKIFLHSQTKKVEKNSWFPFSVGHLFFTLTEVFWKTEGRVNEVFRIGPVRQNFLDET